MQHKKKLATIAVHAGHEPDPTTGAVMMPIYATSTYAQKAPGDHLGYEYSRSRNPTREAYEKAVAALEGGRRGYGFASGLAAMSTILELLSPGDHVLTVDDLYGGSYRLFERVRRFSAGLDFTMMDFSLESAIEAAIKPNTKMIWIETPTNPLMKLVDLEMVAKIARRHNLISVCDNTFASPIIQRPLEYGFDIVMHSATKYLNGHSDIVGGVAVVGDRPELADRLKFLHNAVGGIAAPFDSFMVLRGIKTLAIRMKQHSENAMQIAEYLSGINKVEAVYYPGLKNHPQNTLASMQMDMFGGMISFRLKGGMDEIIKFTQKLELFTLAESLGGVESLICHPAKMTHASIPKEQREKNGVTDNLLRLSVGIEAADDLLHDLQHAIK